MNRTIIAFLFLLASIEAQTQEKMKNIHIDNLGFIYIIQNDKIIKLNHAGEQLYAYANKKLSNITSLDISDPLRIIVFYENFSQLLILDNTLSLSQGPFSLINDKILNPSLVCSASDKGFWIFDKQAYTLHKYDNKMLHQFSISNIPTLINSEFEPVFMLTNNEYLYICDPDNGIFTFDKFGGFYKKMHFKDCYYFDISNNYLFYDIDSVALKIDLMDYSILTMPLNKYRFNSLTFKNENIYLLNDDFKSFQTVKGKFE